MTTHGPIPADGPGRLRVGERVKCRCGCGADLIGTHLGWLKDFKVSNSRHERTRQDQRIPGTPDSHDRKDCST